MQIVKRFKRNQRNYILLIIIKEKSNENLNLGLNLR